METIIDRLFWEIIIIGSLGLTVVCAFGYSLTARHAHRAALALISNEIHLSAYADQTNLRCCLRNLDQTMNFGRSELYVENMRNNVKLVNDAKADLLTSRQQLVLLDSLLGTRTKLHHTRKITRARTVSEIVDIAVKHMRDNMIRTAPQALFN